MIGDPSKCIFKWSLTLNNEIQKMSCLCVYVCVCVSVCHTEYSPDYSNGVISRQSILRRLPT